MKHDPLAFARMIKRQMARLHPPPMKNTAESNPAAALQRKLKKAYRSTTQYKVDQLLASQTRWQRKLTIQNKLAQVRREMDKLLLSLADPKSESSGAADKP